LDPTRIISIQDYTPATLQAVIAQLERSTSVDHFVYREAELDALWSLLEVALRTARQQHAPATEVARLEGLFQAVRQAHDLVAAEAPQAAAARLREVVPT
jgi:hypothetical protein